MADENFIGIQEREPDGVCYLIANLDDHVDWHEYRDWNGHWNWNGLPKLISRNSELYNHTHEH